MFIRLIKKWFFDLWDQLLFSASVNLVVTASVLGVLVLTSTLLPSGALGLLGMVVPITIGACLLGIVAFWARDTVESNVVHLASIGGYWKASWRVSLLWSLAAMVVFVGITVGLPFYQELGTWAGLIFGVLMFWVVIAFIGVSLYTYAVAAQTNSRPRQVFSKALRVFVASPLMSLGLALGSTTLALISVFTLGLFPGVYGILVLHQLVFRWFVLKLEWKEANPGHKGRVPWDQIVQADMDAVGPRSLKGMLFPWKD